MCSYSIRILVLCISAVLLSSFNLFAQNLRLEHQLDVTLHPQTQMMQAIDRVRFQPAPRGLSFWLNPAATIDSVRQGVQSLKYSFQEGRLQIDLPPGNYGSLAEVEIRYQLPLPKALPVESAHHEDPSYGIAAALGPLGAFLGGGARWHPQVEGVRPLMNIRVRIPQQWEAVTNGKLIERKIVEGSKLLHYRVRLNRPGLALAAGPWNLGESQIGDISVYTFFSSQNEGLAERYQNITKTYLSEYSELLGPYPFTKFAIAENFFPSGYGFPSWTLLGSRVIRLPFILRTSLPHEIVHNWFGNGVLVDYAQGNWCEGLTTYLADYYQLEKEGVAPAQEYRLKVLRDYASLVSPQNEYPLKKFFFRSSAADQAIGYGKAMMVFHMLRQTIGEDAFWAGLRQLTQQRMNLETRWSHLQQVFENTSGQPLGLFFSQWIERAGLPRLALDDVTRVKDGEQWRVSGQLRQTTSPYQLDIPLLLQTEGDTLNQTLRITDEKGSFSFTTSHRPLRLEVDPEAHLLRQLYPSEIPPTVNSIRGSQKLLIVLSDNLSSEVLNQAQLLVSALRQDNAKVLRERDLSQVQLKEWDLLFLGIPANRDLLPPLPATLELTSDGFRLNNQGFTKTSDVLFTVLSRPEAPGRSAALFSPRTPQDARTAARKIPHYGKYSYLAFEAGINRQKGTWPAQKSPLIHTFSEGDAS